MKKFLILTLVTVSGWGALETGSLIYNHVSRAESASDVRRELVVDFLRSVVLPKVEEFSALVDDFDQEVQNTCSSSHDLFSLENKMAEVYKSYSFLEAVKFGGLQDPVRAFDIEINPLFGDFSSCIIDKQVAKLAKKPDGFVLDTVRKSRKGLSAIEYLITDQDLNHSCSGSVPQTKSWNEKSESDKKKFRCGYLKLLSSDLKLRSDQLRAEWSPSQGDLVGDIDSNSMGNSSQDLLNQVSDGLYFIELFVKDAKLATPIGLKEDCSGRICKQAFERKSLRYSMQTISQNLNGFLSVFIGNLNHEGNKKGFYSLLKQLGREDIALEIFENVLQAKSAADLILSRNLSFSDIEAEGYKNCRAQERSMMCDIYTPVNNATSVFKTDFYSVLNLRKPNDAPMDND